MLFIYLFLLFLLYFCGPVSAFIFFTVSLVKFISGKAQNKKIPDSVHPNKMYVRKICLIISSIIVCFFIVALAAIIILNSGAISFM